MKGKDATLNELNKNDNPRAFGGTLISDDGINQLWAFRVGRGYRYANRHHDTDMPEHNGWSWDREDIDGWKLWGTIGVPSGVRR